MIELRNGPSWVDVATCLQCTLWPRPRAGRRQRGRHARIGVCLPADRRGLDEQRHQRAAGCAANPLAGMAGGRTALGLAGQRLRVGFRVGTTGRRFGELSFFFRQQLEQHLAARLIGLGGEQPPIMIDVEMGDGPVQRRISPCESPQLLPDIARHFKRAFRLGT